MTVRWLTLTTLAVLGGLCLRLDGIYKILKVVLASLKRIKAVYSMQWIQLRSKQIVFYVLDAAKLC